MARAEWEGKAEFRLRAAERAVLRAARLARAAVLPLIVDLALIGISADADIPATLSASAVGATAAGSDDR